MNQPDKTSKQGEARLQSLLGNTHDVIFEISADGTIASVNTAFERITGWSRADWEGKSFQGLVHPDDVAHLIDRLQRSLAGETLPLFEACVRARSGEYVVGEFTTTPIREDGRITGVWGIGRDITERKRLEEARRSNEEYFRSLIENGLDLITSIDVDGLIHFQSPSCQAALGYSSDQLMQRNLFDFVHSEDAPALRDALHRASRDPERPTSLEFRMRHANGSWRRLESIGKRSMIESRPTIVLNSRDITERRRLEEQFRQSQKMEAVGQLAGGVAHDFNNILATMMMQADLACRTEGLPAEVQEALNDIKVSAERAANLTRQLLAFSRKQVMQPRHLDLNEIVTSMAKFLQRILGEDVRMQLNLHPIPIITYADAGMLDQVLMNLAVNARDALPRGGRLVIETSGKMITEEEAASIPDAAPGRYVCLSVSDTGCGVPPENLPHIFEPFFTTKEPGKGTGLGLATVFGIVKQHGGTIKVYSEVGQGSTFRIFLPASRASRESLARQSAKPKPRGGTETLLVVEDDSAVRTLTRLILEQNGYRVIEATDGVQALKLWDQHAGLIHLLLTDMVMPEGITGRDLAAQLQRKRPELKVIFTSGYSAEIAGHELHLQEGQNFLQKPCPPYQLLQTVRHSLDH